MSLNISFPDAEKRVYTLISKCRRIYHIYGGCDYHDEMHWQLQGLESHIADCVTEKDYEGVLEDVETTFRWFKYIEKIRVLQENLPPSLFC